MIRRRMPIVLPPFEDRLRDAIAQYWGTLETQAQKQRHGVDHGRRGAVTGGKQMNGFAELVDWLLRQNGLGEASIYVRTKRELPGFFRPTKDWDMLVVHEGHLIAAVELTSHWIPPLASDTNTRIEETVGMAADVWTAFREGVYGRIRPRPWLGRVMLLEDRTVSNRPPSAGRAPVEAFPDFSIGSFGRRYEQILHEFTHQRLFDSAALLASPGKGGSQGSFIEPAADLSMKRLLASLASYVGGYLAEVKLRPGSPGGIAPVPSRKMRTIAGSTPRSRASA
jgi:hypothetical protein